MYGNKGDANGRAGQEEALSTSEEMERLEAENLDVDAVRDRVE